MPPTIVPHVLESNTLQASIYLSLNSGRYDTKYPRISLALFLLGYMHIYFYMIMYNSYLYMDYGKEMVKESILKFSLKDYLPSFLRYNALKFAIEQSSEMLLLSKYSLYMHFLYVR